MIIWMVPWREFSFLMLLMEMLSEREKACRISGTNIRENWTMVES